MNDTGYNLRSMRAENKKLLLRLLGAQGPMSRKALAEAAQLTPAAVSKLCTELIVEGRIAETAPAETAGAGRREIPLRLCLQEKLILGVNAETTQISYALCTLSGQLRALLQTPFTTSTAAVLKTAQGFLAAHAVDPEALFAVGVCVVGAVGTGSYGLWDAQAIRAAFEAAFRRPVAVENNVKAFALGQAHLRPAGKGATLFFKWGPGVGSAILSNGTVLSGAESGLAEIGHYIVRPDGKPCRCGRRGCLEAEAAVNGVPSPAVIDTVALALANTATILEADGVVFFGTQFADPAVAEALKARILHYNSTLPPAAVLTAPENDRLAYIGPAALCAERFFFV